MKPCLSEVTTLAATFIEDVEACAAAGCPALEVWLTKLETCLAERPVDEIRRLLAEKQVALVAGSYQGGLLLSQGEQRRTHFEHFRRRLDLCQQFGIQTMLLVADFERQVEAVDLQRAVVSLKQAAQWAAGFDVTLALEFRATDAFCSNLDTALLLIDQAGEANLGVNLDVFHFYKGPSKFEDLDRLNKKNLAFVQVCDVAGTPRELMTDADRILPGEGDFRLDAILQKLHAVGYDGWVSLELMNPVIWQNKATQVAELGTAALKRLLQGIES